MSAVLPVSAAIDATTAAKLAGVARTTWLDWVKADKAPHPRLSGYGAVDGNYAMNT